MEKKKKEWESARKIPCLSRGIRLDPAKSRIEVMDKAGIPKLR